MEKKVLPKVQVLPREVSEIIPWLNSTLNVQAVIGFAGLHADLCLYTYVFSANNGQVRTQSLWTNAK